MIIVLDQVAEAVKSLSSLKETQHEFVSEDLTILGNSIEAALRHFRYAKPEVQFSIGRDTQDQLFLVGEKFAAIKGSIDALSDHSPALKLAADRAFYSFDNLVNVLKKPEMKLVVDTQPDRWVQAGNDTFHLMEGFTVRILGLPMVNFLCLSLSLSLALFSMAAMVAGTESRFLPSFLVGLKFHLFSPA